MLYPYRMDSTQGKDQGWGSGLFCWLFGLGLCRKRGKRLIIGGC
jgi:hypothetical protein